MDKLQQYDRLYSQYKSELLTNVGFGAIVGCISGMLLPSRSLTFMKFYKRSAFMLCFSAGICAGLTSYKYQSYFNSQKTSETPIETRHCKSSHLFFEFMLDAFNIAKKFAYKHIN